MKTIKTIRPKITEGRNEETLEKYKEEVLEIKENFKEIESDLKSFFRFCKKLNIVSTKSIQSSFKK